MQHVRMRATEHFLLHLFLLLCDGGLEALCSCRGDLVLWFEFRRALGICMHP
jgi:hypothetical protein